ncbi:putative retroelement, partial [Globisporangium splendens]
MHGEDHPIAFYSEKSRLHEKSRPAHEKELYTTRAALDKWHLVCADFEFVLPRAKGSNNGVADALPHPSPSFESVDSPFPAAHHCNKKCINMPLRLRRHSIHSSVLQEGRGTFNIGVKQEKWRQSADQVRHVEFAISQGHLSDVTKARFQTGYSNDPEFAPAWKSVDGIEKYEKKNGLLCVRTKYSVSRLCVPAVDQLVTDIFHEFHNGSTLAHPGIHRTQLKVAQRHCWPTLEKVVRAYVLSCGACARWKSNSSKKDGKVMPIPVPSECWEVVSMDFVVGLPVAKGFDAIMTVVDKLPKRPKYAPTHTTAVAEKAAPLYVETVELEHGLPKIIISDRDPEFTSNF